MWPQLIVIKIGQFANRVEWYTRDCWFLQVKGVHDRAVAEVGKWKCVFRGGESTTFASLPTEGTTDRAVELPRVVEWSARVLSILGKAKTSQDGGPIVNSSRHSRTVRQQ